MSDETIAITRRRLLGAVTAVGVAGAGAGSGTVAMISDAETESATVAAGTVDLTLDDKNQTREFLSQVDITAGASGTATVTLENTGSRAGKVVVEVAALRNYENGWVSGEKSKDNSGGDPGQGNGELQNHLEVKATSGDGSAVWADWTLLKDLKANIKNDPGYELTSGATGTFEFDWRLPNDTGKVVQSDSIELELRFELKQTTGA